MTYERKLFVTITLEVSAPDDRLLCTAIADAVATFSRTQLCRDGILGGLKIHTLAGPVTVRQFFRNEHWENGKCLMLDGHP